MLDVLRDNPHGEVRVAAAQRRKSNPRRGGRIPELPTSFLLKLVVEASDHSVIGFEFNANWLALFGDKAKLRYLRYQPVGISPGYSQTVTVHVVNADGAAVDPLGVH